ncbi:MAG TPA: hypothetical protein VML55_13290, partial [Planctomycetaceae bacterium]|nr:hypothetical protein [Planctomycetaceae bacterium]
KQLANERRSGLRDFRDSERQFGQSLRELDRLNALGKYLDEDLSRRKDVRQLFRQLDKTMEWVENNYYELPIEQQNAELVQVNAFWRDFAAHDPGSAFRSVHFLEASRNFTEMMFALSVLDLPPESPEHKLEFADTKLTLTAAGPLIAVHEEIRPARTMDRSPPILVSENFFRQSDRYRYVDNERLDKFVDDEFLVHTVYGAQVVVTNPTSTPHKLDLLVQIPEGAIPVLGSRETRSLHINLEPYRTQAVEYHFYFPAPGEFAHYPAHVAKNEEVLAHSRPVTLKVVRKLSRLDTESWDYLSQHGSDEQVFDWLRQHNLYRVDLAKIAFRMQDAAFFRRVIDLLAARHAYNHTLWSYAILHNVAPAIRQYLQHADAFVQQTGDSLHSPLLAIDPVERKTYQHMEYKPLVNARRHQLGRERRILNDRFFEQYMRLLKVLSYRRTLDDDDLMAVTYYLLLQDRVDEALAFFERVNPDALETRLQHDYFTAYTAFYTGDVDRARAIADQYTDYPVDRWRNLFASVDSQLDEIAGQADPAIVDEDDRTQQQTQLAATEGSFDFTVEAKQVALNYQKLESVRVNYYLMDLELLFSSNPFVQRYAGRFSYIRPNASDTVKLPAGKTTHRFDLPERFHNANVLVEIVAGGQKRTQPYFANSLAVQVVENYGQLQVRHEPTGKAAPKTYVKVYARMADGQVRFYRDGYTDLRGRFDYSSLSTNELDNVERFALLVLSDEHGAVVREADPPKR